VSATVCSPGSFTLNPGASSCTVCPSGSSQPLANQTFCTLCAVKLFNSQLGQAGCGACPLGQVPIDSSGLLSQQGSISCQQCAPGTYLNFANDVCLPCSP